MDGKRNLQWLLDYNEITSLAYIYGRGVDARDSSEYFYFDQCMTQDVKVIYEFGTWQGLDTHKKIVADNMLKVFTFTHHVITNPLVTIDGDEATGSYRVTGAHGMIKGDREEVKFGGSTYIQKCIRTSEGWRIYSHECLESWIDDNGELIALMTGKTS